MPPKKNKKDDTENVALVEPQVERRVRKATDGGNDQNVSKQIKGSKKFKNINEKSEIKPTKPKGKKQENENQSDINNVQNLDEKIGKKQKTQKLLCCYYVKPKRGKKVNAINQEENSEVNVESEEDLDVNVKKTQTQKRIVREKKTKDKNKELTNEDLKPEKKENKVETKKLIEDVKPKRGKTVNAKNQEENSEDNVESEEDVDVNVKKAKTQKLIKEKKTKDNTELINEDLKPAKKEKKLKTQKLSKDESENVLPVKNQKLKKLKNQTKDENQIIHVDEIKLNDQKSKNPAGKKSKNTKEKLVVKIENTKMKKHKLIKNTNNEDLTDETEEKIKQDDNPLNLNVTHTIGQNLDVTYIVMEPVDEPNNNYSSKSKMTTSSEKWDNSNVSNDKDEVKPTTSMIKKTIKNKQKKETQIIKNENQLKIENFSIEYQSQDLFVNANLYITYGRRYGLVGPTRCGKTTLLDYLASRMFELPHSLSIMMYYGKEIESNDITVADYVFKANKSLNVLLDELEKMKAEKVKSTAIQKRQKEVIEELKKIEGFTAHSRALNILQGVGISRKLNNIPSKLLSNNLKRRVSLARLLFIKPNLLLLDEPAKYLDHDGVIWLGNYLQKWDQTLIITSCETSLLDNVCNEIIYIDQHKLHYHQGNYTSWEDSRKESSKI